MRATLGSPSFADAHTNRLIATRQLIGTPDHDFEAGSAIGKVNAMRLPPGDYEAVELYGAQFSNNGQARRPLEPGLRF